MALERNMAQLEAYKKQQSDEQSILKEKMSKIKHKIAIISGKAELEKVPSQLILQRLLQCKGNVLAF